jgi:hypothetical protein
VRVFVERICGIAHARTKMDPIYSSDQLPPGRLSPVTEVALQNNAVEWAVSLEGNIFDPLGNA